MACYICLVLLGDGITPLLTEIEKDGMKPSID